MARLTKKQLAALLLLQEAVDTLESRSQTSCGDPQCHVCPRNRAALDAYREAIGVLKGERK